MRTLGRALFRVGAFLLSAAAVSASAAYSDLPPEHASAFAEATARRDAGDYDAAALHFGRLFQAAPNSFTVAYEYGRLLAQAKKYPDASRVLDKAIALKNDRPTDGIAVYNTKGFVLLMLRKYEEALTYFQRELKSPGFAALEPALRMKVHNNAGYAYLQLDRYQEAKQEFEQARVLGSSLAEKNLEVVNSILETLKASDKDVPGIFAPVVESTRQEAELPNRIASLARQLKVAPSALRWFKRSDGMIHITYGANYNYPKAQRLADDARSKGIADAYVAATPDWVDASQQLRKAK